MSYETPCECGRTLTVAATQAGLTVDCPCGRAVAIPSLSKLRQSAGEDPYKRSMAEVIRAMVDDGELPRDDTCALSGRPTKDTISLYVQCERKWVRRRGNLKNVIVFFLLFGWVGALVAHFAYSKASSRYEELGRDTWVEVPLRVCAEFHQRLQGSGQRELKRILRQDPICAKLLDEYPDAVIAVKGEGTT